MSTEEILEHLDQMFPDAHCELNHRNAFEMAVAVILSAQTTDASVNRVTPALFEKYPDAASLAEADLSDIEQTIASLGLYRNKARSIKGFARAVSEEYDGIVPSTMKELTTLPGVGRKCANVIMSECWGLPALAVDTHVSRIARRLRLAKEDDGVDDIERKLKRRVPRERWTKTHHQMIFFGRYRCHARNPECTDCPFTGFCREKTGRKKV
ncbi:MAG TPA: endonuclease III [Erysipelotrichaceae bacterium]|nr:endonuclease III [Erysipelotrichaceae bacterium]